jgi:catechol 2,3-dioxygenase-like lactoylglutathione lyase family enzyme
MLALVAGVIVLHPAPVLAGQGAPAAAAPAAIINDLPILGLAQVSIKVSDLAKARHFYGNVLGFAEAFTIRDKAGRISSLYMKVNDEQFVELIPVETIELVRQARLVIQSSNLAALHRIYAEKGLQPGPISIGPDGNPLFRVLAPNGFPLDFIEYAAGSRQARLKGKLLDAKRISGRLLHAGTMVRDDATKAFFQSLGWGKLLPGARGDYIETPATDRNLETKNPPLDPNNPATLGQYTREVHGAVYHFALEIDDMHAAREQLKRRGGYDDVRLRAAVGNNRHWLIHLFDLDGSRVELMSRDKVADDIPAFSVMPPGPPAKPILATQRGVYPWP